MHMTSSCMLNTTDKGNGWAFYRVSCYGTRHPTKKISTEETFTLFDARVILSLRTIFDIKRTEREYTFTIKVSYLQLLIMI